METDCPRVTLEVSSVCLCVNPPTELLLITTRADQCACKAMGRYYHYVLLIKKGLGIDCVH